MTLHHGDCLDVMAGMEPESVDAVVTDPPYGLEFMGKSWDRLGAVNRARGDDQSGKHVGSGRGASPTQGRPRFDFGYSNQRRMQEWHQRWAREAYRVAKPSAYLLAFGGTRTVHRMTVALEDAGWIIRDMLVWAYAQGFPKSYNVSGDERFCQCPPSPEHNVRPVLDADVSEAEGDGRRVWPVLFEAVPESRLPAAPVQSSEGQLWAEEWGLEGRGDDEAAEGQLRGSASRPGAGVGATDGAGGRLHRGASAGHGSVGRTATDASRDGQPRRSQPVPQRAIESRSLADERGPQAGRGWPRCDRCGKSQVPRGLGTALKPAWEPIVLARKPSTGSVAADLERYGTGALNIDGTRIGYVNEQPPDTEHWTRTKGGWKNTSTAGVVPNDNTLGRWPANVILTDPIFDGGWDGVVGGGETPAGAFPGQYDRNDKTQYRMAAYQDARPTDSGTYSRFFLEKEAEYVAIAEARLNGTQRGLGLPA